MRRIALINESNSFIVKRGSELKEVPISFFNLKRVFRADFLNSCFAMVHLRASEPGRLASPQSRFPSQYVFTNLSSDHSLCCSNLNPIPIFVLFCGHESQSQCMKTHAFPSFEKGKSHFTPSEPFLAACRGSLKVHSI